MAEEVLLVFSTFGNEEEARRVGRLLVEEELVACANILPGIESIYRWKGEIETGHEILMLLKTTRGSYGRLESRLKALHSYEVPEIIAVPVAAGLPAYLRWVAGE